MKKYILAILFLITIIFPPAAQAQSVVGVSPVILNIELSPGKTYTYDVTISNSSRSPLPVKLTFDNFNTDEKGIDLSPGNTQNDNSILPWVAVSPQDLIIPAQSKKTVTITITLPKRIPVGGYYGVLFVEPIISAETKTSIVSAKVGVLMLANIGVSSKKNTIEFVSSTYDKKIYSQGPVKNTFRIKNTTLNHFSAKPVLTVEPLLGKKTTIPLEEKIIFPGKIRLWDAFFELPDYYHGYYKTTLTVSTGNGQVQVLENYILAFPVLQAVGTLILVTLVLLTIIFRRRVSKAVRILLSGR
jgi:hypothetical protein